jgi:hypothetical protein
MWDRDASHGRKCIEHVGLSWEVEPIARHGHNMCFFGPSLVRTLWDGLLQVGPSPSARHVSAP